MPLWTRSKNKGVLPVGLDRGNVTVEPPRDPAHGDLATNAAMVLAKPAGAKPRELAEALAEELRGTDGCGGGVGGGAGLPQPDARGERVG